MSRCEHGGQGARRLWRAPERDVLRAEGGSGGDSVRLCYSVYFNVNATNDIPPGLLWPHSEWPTEAVDCAVGAKAGTHMCLRAFFLTACAKGHTQGKCKSSIKREESACPMQVYLGRRFRPMQPFPIVHRTPQDTTGQHISGPRITALSPSLPSHRRQSHALGTAGASHDCREHC